MYSATILRDFRGKVLGKFGKEFLDHYKEDECWQDIKIPPDEIIFPRHNQTLPSPVKTYHISELSL